MITKNRTVRTLRVPYESVLFLCEEQHKQRTEKEYRPLSDTFKRRLQNNLNSDGTRTIEDYDYGGCVGDPHNAYEEHRWTWWTLEDMMRMLDEAGLPYGDIRTEQRTTTTIYI